MSPCNLRLIWPNWSPFLPLDCEPNLWVSHPEHVSMISVKNEYEVQVLDDEPEDDYTSQNEFDSSVSGEIPYEYNQEGESYTSEDQRTYSSSQMDYTAATEVKRLTDQYLQRIEINGCVVWTCTKCGKQGKMKHHVREHGTEGSYFKRSLLEPTLTL